MKKTANPGRGKNRRKQRSGPGGEWQGAPGKLSTLFSAGNTRSPGYLWSLSGGRRGKKEPEGGPALEPRCWNWAAEGSPCDSRAFRAALEDTRIPAAFYQELEERSRSETSWKKQVDIGFTFGPSSFDSWAFSKELTGSASLRGLCGERPSRGKRSVLQGAGRTPRRRFCHFAVTLFPSLWDSWPPFWAAPPCLCWQGRKKLVGLLHPPSGGNFNGFFLRIAGKWG